MGLKDFLKKTADFLGKEAKKYQINRQKEKEIENLKIEFLTKLSHKELVQIYKLYLGE